MDVFHVKDAVGPYGKYIRTVWNDCDWQNTT